MTEESNEKIIYTDGREVTVTDAKLQVRKHEYMMNGITRCAVKVIKPNRIPAILLMLVGISLIAIGLLEMVPEGTVPNLEIANQSVGGNALAIWAGAALTLIGTLILGLMRERYAVRIGTAEGEKDAVISNRKEYVNQIADAINQAASFVRTKTGSRYFTVRSANGGSW